MKNQENSKSIATFRTFMLNQLDTYSLRRVRQIDEVIAELKQRAEDLKEHINSQKAQVVAKFDLFANEVLNSDKYDYLTETDIALELQELFKVKFVAESPIRADFAEIFSQKGEIQVEMPSRQPDNEIVAPQVEIAAPIQLQLPETDKFNSENLQEFFDFEDENRTVIWKKGQGIAPSQFWSSVKTISKSSATNSIHIK